MSTMMPTDMLLNYKFSFFFFSHTRGMRKFLAQGSNPCHISDVRSLIHWGTPKLSYIKKKKKQKTNLDNKITINTDILIKGFYFLAYKWT